MLVRMSHPAIDSPGQPTPHHTRARRAFATAAIVAVSLTSLATTLATIATTPAGVQVAPPQPDSSLRVTFLDVGQGDAILLQAPEGQTALIDASRGDIVPLLREMGVTGIDLLVATHPHADHIGGMTGVLESFPVRFYMDNADPHTTATYRRLLSALEARPEITYLEATPRTITLGSASLEVLPLLPRGSTDHNNRSVSLVLRFGDFTALLSGDSEVRQLTHFVNQQVVPKLTLLKAAHHGSDNGFTWSFLQTARPEVVVISVGRNGYGHPRPAALEAYAATAGETLRTDLHGHVQVQGHRDGAYAVVRGAQVASAASSGRPRITQPPVIGAETPVASVAPRPAPNTKLRLSVTADAPGNDHQNLNGEYVIIESTASESLAISGWQLCDRLSHCFRFPDGAVLKAGAQIVVHTGTGQPDGIRYYMGRRQAVWNNDGDTATLFDGSGAIVLVFSY